MKIEKEIISFSEQFSTLSGISDLQKLYLQILQGGKSIEGVVDHFLKQGWLVNFSELYDLISRLTEGRAIRNASFYQYFEKIKPASERSIWNSLIDLNLTSSPVVSMRLMRELPFFRSLEPKLTDLFLSKASIHHVAPKTLLCRQGDTTRDLYVILKGTAGVYKPHAHGGKYLIATLAQNSAFGEGAFLLGNPRAADVISLSDCNVLRVPCIPEVFDQFLKREKAQSLQYRFWVQHALLKSETFKEVPPDCFDALTLCGRCVCASEGQVLFNQGEEGRSAYIVIQGSLVVNQNGQNIGVISQGGVLGEIALLANQGIRSASVISQKESLLLEINQNEFYRLLAQNIFLGKILQELAIQRLAKDQQRAA